MELSAIYSFRRATAEEENSDPAAFALSLCPGMLSPSNMLRDRAHTCAAQTHPHKHIFQHVVSTRALRAVAVSQPFPCPPTSGALKGGEPGSRGTG